MSAQGHTIEVAATAEEGLALARQAGYDVLLIDLGRQDGGTDLLHRLRQHGVPTPILVMDGGLGPAHVVRALDAGADEYISGPVNAEEIAARVRALARRVAPVPPLELAIENVALNIVAHPAFVDQRQLRLTPKEFALLQHFMARRGELVSRAELLAKVWEMHFDPGSNVVDVHVSRLRSKLQRAGARLAIEAVRGAGFRLNAVRPTDTRQDGVA